MCVPSMDALWGHKTSLSEGSGPHSHWWSDMKRSAWGSKGSLDGSKSVIKKKKKETTKPFHLFGLVTWALAVKGDAFITCLHMLKLFLFQSSQCVVNFTSMLNCTWGNKGQEKWNILLQALATFGLDSCISFYFHTWGLDKDIMAFQCCALIEKHGPNCWLWYA